MKCADCQNEMAEAHIWTFYVPDIGGCFEMRKILCQLCYNKREKARLQAQEELKFLNELDNHPRFKKNKEQPEKVEQPSFLKRVANKVFRRKEIKKSKSMVIIPIEPSTFTKYYSGD